MGSAVGALPHKAGNQVTLIDVSRPAIEAVQSRGLIIQNKAGERKRSVSRLPTNRPASE
jgi:ketopantoate reductase